MPRFDSAIQRVSKPDDIISYLQGLPEVGKDTSMAVLMESGKVQAVEIDGISQVTFDSVMAKVQLQFPAAF